MKTTRKPADVDRKMQYRYIALSCRKEGAVSCSCAREYAGADLGRVVWSVLPFAPPPFAAASAQFPPALGRCHRPVASASRSCDSCAHLASHARGHTGIYPCHARCEALDDRCFHSATQWIGQSLCSTLIDCNLVCIGRRTMGRSVQRLRAGSV